MELLTHNVPTSQVASVITSVLKLAHVTPSHVPVKSTVIDWNIMRLVLGQQQLAEELPQREYLGLLSDETSKFGNKYEVSMLVTNKVDCMCLD